MGRLVSSVDIILARLTIFELEVREWRSLERKRETEKEAFIGVVTIVANSHDIFFGYMYI